MYSIVIIEDDPVYISMMETILQIEGFDVCSASDGRSGLGLLREKRPDLILCDVMMPEMDGHSVLEALKGEKTLADIPFIFVTALGERADQRRGMAAGADDYLSKPFTAGELLAAVNGRLLRRKLNRECLGWSDHAEEQAFLRQKITPREREVLRLVGQGVTSKEIAGYLGVCLKTVEVHRANLMKKLDARNVAALSRWALILEQMESRQS